jgi:GntR family transcriptional regulator
MADTGQADISLRNSRQPLYTQAIVALQELLEQGEYHPGDLLPSEGVLAKRLGISRSTLREALGHLETHGLVSRRQGVGTFVGAPVQSGFMGGLERLDSFHSLAAAAGMEVKVAERQVASLPATADLAARIALEPGADLIRVQVVEAVNGRRTAYLNTYVSAEFAGLDDLAAFDGSVIDYLAEGSEPRLSHTRSEIISISAGPEVSARLEVPPEATVLHLLEVYYAQDGRTMAVSFNYFLTDKFRFYVIRRVPRRRGGA